MGHLLYLSNLSAKTDDLVVPQVGIEGPRNVVPNVDRYPESPLRRNEETLAMHFSQKNKLDPNISRNQHDFLSFSGK